MQHQRLGLCKSLQLAEPSFKEPESLLMFSLIHILVSGKFAGKLNELTPFFSTYRPVLAAPSHFLPLSTPPGSLCTKENISPTEEVSGGSHWQQQTCFLSKQHSIYTQEQSLFHTRSKLWNHTTKFAQECCFLGFIRSFKSFKWFQNLMWSYFLLVV